MPCQWREPAAQRRYRRMRTDDARYDGPSCGVQFGKSGRALPKTCSGAILSFTMAKIADGETFQMPETIDDPVIFDEIKTAL